MPPSPLPYPIRRHPYEEAFSTAAATATPHWPWHLFIYPPLFPSFCFPTSPFFSLSACLSRLTPGTGRQTPANPPPVPWNTNSHIGPTARDPALLTEVEWRGREGGVWQRRQLVWGNIVCGCDSKSFQEKQDFIHNGRGCEERGHILKEAPLCVHCYCFF